MPDTSSTDTKHRLKYVTVTVTEGGADFDECYDPSEVDFSINMWYNKDGGEATRRRLQEAELGEEITLDGCSTCFVLKG